MNLKEFLLAFLFLDFLLIGTFCFLDLLLFYVFFESVLIPDEKLTVFTLFCTLNLPGSLLINFVVNKLTSLALAGKYNYFLLNRGLPVTVNSLGNKFYILVEVTQTYKTFTYCFSPFWGTV